jgi:rare lipoprotein A (peptidoglycan hydrolase)
MHTRHIHPIVLCIAISLIAVSNTCFAQSFNDRWTIIPRANAEPSPPSAQGVPRSSPAQPLQAQPQRDTTGQSESATRASTSPAKPNPSAQSHRKKVASPAKKARTFTGNASFISYSGGKTASGAPYRPQAFTAAHRTLAFGTRLKVRDAKTGKSVQVVVTDRGPFINNRVLDLSRGAAQALGMIDRGVIQIEAEVVGSKVQVAAEGK